MKGFIMITYNMINNMIKKEHLSSDQFEAYEGLHGVGIVYRVKIKDYGQYEHRLAKFETEEDLNRFILYAKYSDEILTDNMALINSKPMFYLEGRVLTGRRIEEIIKDSDAQKKLYLYQKKRGKLILWRKKVVIEEIHQLETFINRNSSKDKLPSKSDIEIFLRQFESDKSFEIEEIPDDIEEVMPKEIPDLKYEYCQLVRKKEKLMKKIKALIDLSKNRLKKFFLTQKTIDDAISRVDDDDNNGISTKDNIIREGYITLIELFDKYKIGKASILSSSYYEMCLRLLKEYDEILVDQLNETFFTKAENELRTERQKLYRDAENNHIPSEEEKMIKVFENLKSQYDKNLKEEQKNALIIYNSRLFELINIITSIPNYRTMNSRAILESIKKLTRYNDIVKTIFEYCKMMNRDGFCERRR